MTLGQLGLTLSFNIDSSDVPSSSKLELQVQVRVVRSQSRTSGLLSSLGVIRDGGLQKHVGQIQALCVLSVSFSDPVSLFTCAVAIFHDHTIHNMYHSLANKFEGLVFRGRWLFH